MRKNKLIALMIFIIMGCCLLIVGCNSATKNLYVTSIIGDDNLKLPFKPKRGTAAGNKQVFTVDMTLEEMGEKIKSDNIQVEVFGSDFLLITKTIPGNKIRYYIIAKTAYERYWYMNPASIIADKYFIFTPFHLLGLSSETQSVGLPYSIDAGVEYKINSTYEKIADFYKSIDIYDVTEESSRIIISVKEGANIPDDNGRHTRDCSFAIEFEEKEDGTYATYRTID